MKLVELSLQPLDYTKGYAEALKEVEELDAEEADIYMALTRCLDLAHDARKLSGQAPSADLREWHMGQAQAFSECGEAYRQLGEVKGWDEAPCLSGFISWRQALSLGLIDKEQ